MPNTCPTGLDGFVSTIDETRGARMTTTPDQTVQTWRDLADQLTAQQVAALEWQESRGEDCVPDEPDAYRDWLITQARDYIAGNEHDAELSARIQPPAGATSIGGWDNIDPKTDRLLRSIRWANFPAGPAFSVAVDGFQDETGAVDGPHISVYGLEDGPDLEAADALRLARALVAAADHREGLK
jgi:hypothetical protein